MEICLGTGTGWESGAAHDHRAQGEGPFCQEASHLVVRPYRTKVHRTLLGRSVRVRAYLPNKAGSGATSFLTRSLRFRRYITEQKCSSRRVGEHRLGVAIARSQTAEIGLQQERFRPSIGVGCSRRQAQSLRRGRLPLTRLRSRRTRCPIRMTNCVQRWSIAQKFRCWRLETNRLLGYHDPRAARARC